MHEKMNNRAQAELFIGPQTLLVKETLSYLQQILCPKKGCKTCTRCQQIENKTHHATVWIEPEKRYTLDLLDIVFKKTMLSLDKEEICFFIFTKADFLSPACANSLLKLVEEPPQGYHFLFLAERFNNVLPTIRSRCIQKQFAGKADAQEVPLLVHHFMRFDSDPLAFTKELSSCFMTEQECIVYLDYLLDFWITTYKRAATQNNETLQKKSFSMINLCKKAVLSPPAPGSAKIFWKNLFLQKEQG